MGVAMLSGQGKAWSGQQHKPEGNEGLSESLTLQDAQDHVPPGRAGSEQHGPQGLSGKQVTVFRTGLTTSMQHS